MVLIIFDQGEGLCLRKRLCNRYQLSKSSKLSMDCTVAQEGYVKSKRICYRYLSFPHECRFENSYDQVELLTDEGDEALLLVLGEALPPGAEAELLPALAVRRHLRLALVLEAAVEVVRPAAEAES